VTKKGWREIERWDVAISIDPSNVCAVLAGQSGFLIFSPLFSHLLPFCPLLFLFYLSTLHEQLPYLSPCFTLPFLEKLIINNYH